MFKLVNIIFGFFGLAAKVDDKYKDSNGKGLSQRFNELLAGDLDDNELDLVNYFIENLVDPFTMLEKYIIYEESRIGLHLPIYTDNYFRRKILPLMYSLYNIKGTITAYEQFFRMLGFDTVEIIEGTSSNGFDHPTLTLDSDQRRFDSRGALSGFYDVVLTGTAPISESLVQVIYNVIELNEPIWATLRSITYNGTDIDVIVDGGKGSFNESFNSSFDK